MIKLSHRQSVTFALKYFIRWEHFYWHLQKFTALTQTEFLYVILGMSLVLETTLQDASFVIRANLLQFQLSSFLLIYLLHSRVFFPTDFNTLWYSAHRTCFSYRYNWEHAEDVLSWNVLQGVILNGTGETWWVKTKMAGNMIVHMLYACVLCCRVVSQGAWPEIYHQATG